MFNREPIIFMMVFAFIVVIIPAIVLLVIDNKSKKQRSILTRENKFVSNNRENIERKLDENSNDLKIMRFKALLSAVVLAVGIIVSFFIIRPIIISIIICIVLSIIMGININKYIVENSEKFAEVVKNALHDFNKDLEYYPKGGFTEEEYKLCLFPEMCDQFSSEDMIVNPKSSFIYSDILVESEYEDSDGDTHYRTEFCGSLARINIENVNCAIYLGSTPGKFIFRNDGFKKIDFENDEFNKLFRACSSNELLAYKLLTPDIMEKFVKIKNETFGDIDIRIYYDKLYIRFLSGDTFDSTLFNKRREKEALLQSFAVLDEVMKTMEKVRDLINKKNVE